MQVVILAGGLGKRLRSLVDDRPKPMAEVNGRPFLAYVFEEFKKKGFRDFLLLVGYLWEQIYAYFGYGETCGIDIKYSVEESLLGTGGAIRLAIPMLEETFILVNGDTLVSFPGTGMIEYHYQKNAEITVMLTCSNEESQNYGNIIIDQGTGKVQQFVEKPEKMAFGLTTYINAGIYICQRRAFTNLPAGEIASLEKDILPLMAEGGSLYGYITNMEFVDIGVPKRLQDLRQEVVERKGKW